MNDVLSTPVVLAAIGGLAVNLLNLLELQQVPKERRPDFADWLYWFPFLMWPIIGGVVGFLYNDLASPLSKLAAFHLGVSSPLILRSLASAIPAQAKQQLPPGA